MKHIYRFLILTITLLIFCSSVWVIPVSAATVSIQSGKYETGQSFSIKIDFNADDVLRVVDATIEYDPSKLKLNSVEGADYSVSNKTITIYDEAFSGNVKKSSYTLNFTAISEGNCKITADVTGGGFADSYAKNSATITITKPKPSSNADLSSIKLSKGSLSPAFKADVTDYTAKVKYDVDEITISATPADGKSRVTGGGTFALNVGKNEKFINVTAQDGTRKIYTLNITRMSEQETQEAEQAERDANPLLVVINGNDYKIVNDLTNVTIPAGFTKTTTTRKESEITVLKDTAEKYELCWLVDQNGENGAFYSRDAEDNFTKLIYISVGEKMYIIEEFDMLGDLPDGFEFSNCTIAGNEVESIGYTSEGLKDFNIFNCYINGKNDYYCLDSVDGTMQRALDFSVALQNKDDPQAQIDVQVETQTQTENKKGISKTGLLVLGLVAVVAILLIVLAIVLIVKIASPNRKDDAPEILEQFENDFILQDTEDIKIDDIQK